MGFAADTAAIASWLEPAPALGLPAGPVVLAGLAGLELEPATFVAATAVAEHVGDASEAGAAAAESARLLDAAVELAASAPRIVFLFPRSDDVAYLGLLVSFAAEHPRFGPHRWRRCEAGAATRCRCALAVTFCDIRS